MLNAVKLHHTAKMNHSEWEKQREELNTIGGSDMATVMGVNDFKTPLRLYLEMVGDIPRKKPEPNNEYVEWGNRLEPIVADAFRDKTGLEVRRCNYILQHPNYPYMTGNIDREVRENGERGILEIKTANEFMKNEWSGEFVPDAYMVQIHHYMAITGAKFAYIAVLIGGNKYKHWRIERNDELIAAIENAAAQFIYNVEHRIRPAADGSDDASDLLKQLYPAGDVTNEKTEIYADDYAAMIEERIALKAQIKELDSRVKTIDNLFKDEIKDKAGANVYSERGDLVGFAVWPKYERKKVNDAAMMQEAPQIVEQYEELKEKHTIKAPYRRFDIKKPKGE